MANTKITSRVIADDAVTTSAIADDAITSAKLDTNIAVAGTLTVTGDITGTLATAAQSNITSIGTLTGLTLSGEGLAYFALGTYSSSASNNAGLRIRSSSGAASGNWAGMTFQATSGDSTGTNWQQGITTGSGSYASDFVIKASTGASSMAERLRITNGGNVGIGTTSIDEKLHVQVASGDAALKLEDATSYMRLDQNSIGADTVIRFKTGSNLDERMRISSTGAVGIGTTNPDAPLHIEATNASMLLSNSGRTQYWRIQNYESSDDLVINANDTSEKIRILSSGGITFNGDTATANALDDYEEGTFTVTATPSVSGTVTLTSLNVGYYTKIGNRVFFSYRADVASVSSPSGRLNMNLPFAVANISPSASSRSTATTFIYNSIGTNISDFVSFIPTGTSFVSLYIGSSATGSNSAANQMQAGTEIHLAGHYITN